MKQLLQYIVLETMHTTPQSKPNTPNTMENSVLVSCVSLVTNKQTEKSNRNINIEVQDKIILFNKTHLAI